MVNFGPLAAEIVSLVWGTPENFNGFLVLAALLHVTLVLGVSQTAAFNTGRHLYSAGRPSLWALAHVLVLLLFYSFNVQSVRDYGRLSTIQFALPDEARQCFVESERPVYEFGIAVLPPRFHGAR